MNNAFDTLLHKKLIEPKQQHFFHPMSQQPAHALLHTLIKTSHKGNFAHVAILEGSENTTGASRLAALASLRAGASLVTLLTENFDCKPGDMPEFMKRKASMLVKDDLQDFDSVVVGPGLGTTKLLQTRAQKIIRFAAQLNIPVIIDADALPFLLSFPWNDKRNFIIATPHPGEAARLLNCSAQEIESNRLQAAQKLTELPINDQIRTIFVLKGSSPIIIQKGLPAIECEGNVPALSIGGSGDILCGIIAALIKQTADPFLATLVAVSAHLQAGRILEQTQLRGSLASDIANALPKVLYSPHHEPITYTV